MANNVRLDALRTKIRTHARKPHTNRPTNAELLVMINSSYQSLYDILMVEAPQLILSTDNITVTADTGNYDLPDDFFKLWKVLLYDTSRTSNYLPLEPCPWEERYDSYLSSNKYDARYTVFNDDLYLWPVPDWSGTVMIEYIPTAGSYTDDSDTLNMYNGWDDYIMYDVAARLHAGDKELDLKQTAEADKQRVQQRILASCSFDIGSATKITDVRYGGLRRSKIWGL